MYQQMPPLRDAVDVCCAFVTLFGVDALAKAMPMTEYKEFNMKQAVMKYWDSHGARCCVMPPSFDHNVVY